jgi:osmotically inducible protein OsmC
MPTRISEAVWTGTLREGRGTMRLGSGAYEGAYTYASRFEEAPGANPEELIGAAHAGCFSMYLASLLTKAGFPPDRVHTTAKVHLGEGRIHTIELDTEAEVPNVDDETFQRLAEDSKKNCPVSQALTGPQVRMTAKLV